MNQLSLDILMEALAKWNGWVSVADIALVTLAILGGFLLIRGTRAVQVLRGFVVVAFVVLLLSSIPGLVALFAGWSA
jgi:DNA integrity scanning protein DisA with diadenylate cyclase activity